MGSKLQWTRKSRFSRNQKLLSGDGTWGENWCVAHSSKVIGGRVIRHRVQWSASQKLPHHYLLPWQFWFESWSSQDGVVQNPSISRLSCDQFRLSRVCWLDTSCDVRKWSSDRCQGCSLPHQEVLSWLSSVHLGPLTGNWVSPNKPVF